MSIAKLREVAEVYSALADGLERIDLEVARANVQIAELLNRKAELLRKRDVILNNVPIQLRA